MNRLTDLMVLMRARRSIRRFAERAVERETVTELVEAASSAPSASNRQDWRFTAVYSHRVKQEVAEAVRSGWQGIMSGHADSGTTAEVEAYASNFDWFAEVPVLMVVSCRQPETFLQHMLGARASDVAGGKASAAMAVQNLMLAAHAAGLGTCCLTGPLAAEERIKEILGTGKRRALVCLVGIGYPAEMPGFPGRKDVDEILEFVE